MKKISIKELTLVSLMSALICVISPFAVPIGPLPISLAVFIIHLSAVLLGGKLATLSCIVYLLLGAFGLPIFASFNAGVAYIAGPTGGYLLGFIFMILISGVFISKYKGNVKMYILGMILGTIVDYLFGTLWFSYQQNTTFLKSLLICVGPFVIVDLIKIIFAAIIGEIIRKQLVKAAILK